MNTTKILKALFTNKKTVSVENVAGVTIVRYYETEIAFVGDGIVKIYAGGWYTATTKRYINAIFDAFGVGACLYQKGNIWYVKVNGVDQVFFDGFAVSF